MIASLSRRNRRRGPERGGCRIACLLTLAVAGGVRAADVPVAPAAEPSDAGGILARPVPIDDAGSAAVAPPAAGGTRPSWPLALPAAGPVGWLVVAGLALLAARGVSRRAARPLPGEVFALLGEAPMGGTQVARVVRFGPKTVLVGVSGSTCTTLAVIDDPHVTETLAAACRGPGATPAAPLVDHLRDAVARALGPARRAEAVR